MKSVLSKFSVLPLVAASVALLGVAPVAQAQLVSKPIRLMVGQPAGGGTDAIARIIAQKMSEEIGQSIVVAVVGVLMIVYVLIGGMKGTTWVQIIKAVLLIAGAAVITVWTLAKFGFSITSGDAFEAVLAVRPASLRDFDRRGFRNAFHIDGCAGFTGTFGNRVGHGFDMAVH